jgi:hypothetical protein
MCVWRHHSFFQEIRLFSAEIARVLKQRIQCIVRFKQKDLIFFESEAFMKKAVLLTCASLLIATVPAFGATTAPQIFTFVASATDWAQTLNVNQFDSSLGTLTGVQITVDGDMSALLTIVNTSTKKSSNGTANAEVDFELTGPSGLTQTLNLAPADDDSIYYMLGKGTSLVSSTPLTQNGSVAATWNTAGILAAFTGSGITTLNLDATNMTILYNNGGSTYISEDSLINAGSTVTLTYTYHVPEPTTIGILSFGTMLIFRKKNK